MNLEEFKNKLKADFNDVMKTDESGTNREKSLKKKLKLDFLLPV